MGSTSSPSLAEGCMTRSLPAASVITTLITVSGISITSTCMRPLMTLILPPRRTTASSPLCRSHGPRSGHATSSIPGITMPYARASGGVPSNLA